MFPFGSRLTPPSRLPRPIPPFPGETTTSYLHRLGIANQLQPGDLRAHLTGTRQRVPVTLDGLAAATGKSPRGLSYALPELRPGTPPGADPVLPAHVRRTICWRCAARRGVFGFATIWQPAEVNICRSHLIWLGSAVRAGRGQHSVGHLPEILRAQRRHCRLAQCRDRQAAADAFAEAAHITALWAHHGFHRDRRIPLIRAFPGRASLTGELQPGDPVMPIVTYPETVDLAHVLATPRWRHPAAPASNNELRQFRHDIDQHLGIKYHPEDSVYDPLFGWFCKRHGLSGKSRIRWLAS